MVKNMIGGNTDFDEIAERINDSIDFSEVRNREDYKRLMKNHLRRQRDQYNNLRGNNLTRDSTLDSLFDTRDTQNRFDTEEVITPKVQKFKRRRPKERIIIRRKGRIKREPLKRFRKKPIAFDIRRIPKKKLMKHPEKFVITKKDLRLKKKGITISINVRGIKQARDKKGRFVKIK